MENNNVRVSIVVPIYNVEKYLEKCIESIINQSYSNIEIILVDDGSTDRCPMICDAFVNKDSRVKVIHKKNGGLVSARKAGTTIATGEYILNVDGDDWIEQGRINTLVTEGIIPGKPDMVYLSGYKKDFRENSVLIDCDIPIKTFYGDEVKRQIFPLLMEVNGGFLEKVMVSMWMWAVKRELLQEKQKLVDDRIVMAEDIICIWFCLLSAKTVRFIKQNGYHYIQRKSSVSYLAATTSGSDDLRIRIWYCQLKKYLTDHKVSKEINQIFVYFTIFAIMQANYCLLLEKNEDYLYPFPKVKKGHKIIVYGAGRIGYSLMRFLSKTQDYQIVLWVDKDITRYALPGYKISPVDEISNVEYDYIVVAVQRADIVKEIRESLMDRKIPEEKIAIIDATVVTKEAIPDNWGGVLYLNSLYSFVFAFFLRLEFLNTTYSDI